jgi:hypothetical protein
MTGLFFLAFETAELAAAPVASAMPLTILSPRGTYLDISITDGTVNLPARLGFFQENRERPCRSQETHRPTDPQTHRPTRIPCSVPISLGWLVMHLVSSLRGGSSSS